EFLQHPLSRARVETVHGRGTPPVRVSVTDLWDMEHQGGPTRLVPIACVPAGPDAVGIPLTPREVDFSLGILLPNGGKSRLALFPACREYLHAAEHLTEVVEEILERTHGTHSLTRLLQS